MKIKFLVFFLMVSSFSYSQDLRVEPPNWWAGMEHHQIQLLVYGENISELETTINYEGVSIDSVVKVDNPNYLFVYVNISENVQPGTMTIEFKKGRRTREKFEFGILGREEDSRDRAGFNPSDVMYLITPDRFVNGDTSNDVIEGMRDKYGRDDNLGRHGGDIKGMLDRLDYIEEMGFTAIWVNPVLENDMERGSYHGYATTDFYKVDPRYGSNQEYADFSKAASARGIKLIMDMIVNHSGSEHWFVKDPPTADWINFDNQYSKTSHRRFTIQDIYASEYDKKQFSDGWFVETMPDLNQRNRMMSEYLIQNTIWWIEYAGLAGIRMDTYPYPDKDFMNDWTCAVLREYPDFNIVGEEWVDKPAIVSYWQRGKVNHDGYTSCLPSLMDFPIQSALNQSLNTEEKKYGSGLILLYEKLAQDFLYPEPDNMVVFPDNHDMDRFFTQVKEDYDLFKMGISYILTTRGIPQIYYGTEILMQNSEAPGDHGVIRGDFPGGWEGDAINAFDGTGLTDQQKDAQEFLKNLLNWRKNNAAIHNGRLMQFSAEEGIYVFFRYTDTKKIMVMMNKNNDATAVDMNRFAEMTEGLKNGVDVITETTYSLEGELTVPAKSALILELN